MQEEDQNKNKSHLLEMRTLCHELRSPLATAMMAFESIRSGDTLEGQTWDLMFRSLSKMKGLIESALEEASANCIKLHRTDVDLGGLLQDAVAFCKYLDKAKGLTIDVRAEDIVCSVDAERMSSVILNLIQNAIKFTKPNTTIWVTGKRIDNGLICIEVEDQCGGIEGDPEELFRPYVQGTKNRSGIGLGLAIARKIVTAHQGQLSCRSLPNGCVFSVLL